MKIRVLFKKKISPLLYVKIIKLHFNQNENQKRYNKFEIVLGPRLLFALYFFYWLRSKTFDAAVVYSGDKVLGAFTISKYGLLGNLGITNNPKYRVSTIRLIKRTFLELLNANQAKYSVLTSSERIERILKSLNFEIKKDLTGLKINRHLIKCHNNRTLRGGVASKVNYYEYKATAEQ